MFWDLKRLLGNLFGCSPQAPGVGPLTLILRIDLGGFLCGLLYPGLSQEMTIDTSYHWNQSMMGL